MEALPWAQHAENTGVLIVIAPDCEVVVLCKERQAEWTQALSTSSKCSEIRVGMSLGEKLVNVLTLNSRALVQIFYL